MSTRASWYEARAIASAAPVALPPEQVDLAACVGRSLARDALAPIDLPHFASSAMDGWLTVGDGPWTLTHSEPAPGQARAIVTGALVATESGAAVLRSESGTVVDGVLHSRRTDEPRPGQHIRPRGTDAARGDVLIAAGVMLNPAHIALVASAGLDDLRVHAQPEVALVLTGDEVVAAGIPAPGFVRDTFGIQLPRLLPMLGARVTAARRVADDIDDTIRAIRESEGSLIITTGGTGSSPVDHVRPALDVLGASVLLDGVAMRPGGPTTLARLPDGRLILCLPGNPLAAMVAMITLGEPVIAGLSGRPPRPPRGLSGIDVAGRAGSTRLMPYRLVNDRIALVPWQGAGTTRGLAEASGLLVVPDGGTTEGARVEVMDLPWFASSPPSS